MDSSKVKDFFKHNIGYFVIAVASIVYIATGILTIQETGKTVAQTIGDSVIILFLGLFINRIFDIQGLMNGDREKEVVDAVTAHENKITELSKSIDRLDAWCEIKNTEALKVARIKILAPSGLKYDDCFNEAGVGKGFSIDYKKKIPFRKRKKEREKYIDWKKELLKSKLYHKALTAKITLLNSNVLTSEGGKGNDPNYLGRSKKQYETKSSISDIISKSGLFLIFGYFGVGFIQDFNYLNLLWLTLQVTIFLVMGIVKLYQSFLFVKNEFKDRIQSKTKRLQEFQNFINFYPNITELEKAITCRYNEEKQEDNQIEEIKTESTIPDINVETMIENLNKGDVKENDE